MESFVSKDVCCVKGLNCELTGLVLRVGIKCVNVMSFDDFKQGENPVEVRVLWDNQRDAR